MKTDKLKNRLLEFYLLGFKNEIDFCDVPNKENLKKSYLLGKKHSDAGDTFESTEYLNDDIIEYLIEKEELNY